MNDNIALAMELNELCEELNRINDQYPRTCGTLVMVSSDTEDMIEGILARMENDVQQLSDLSDDEIEEFTDVAEFRPFLEQLREIIGYNKQAVADAREFLQRYHAC